jgi:hypothetical protein
MTTQRQHASNQVNARASTGPKSSGGEGNARKHGLTASQCFSDEEKQMIDARRAELEVVLKPEGRLQHDEVLAIAQASIRLERCLAEEQAWRLRRAERAEFYWHADQELETMNLVQRLPKKPDLIAAKLRQSLRGCMWMLNEWRSLAGLVEPASAGESLRPLDEVGRRRAGDLLGLSAEQRLGRTALDLPGGGGSDAELAAHQRGLIATQIAIFDRLTGPDRVALDESIRVDTMNGVNLTVDDKTRLIRRYETEARRVKERALARLQQLKDEAAALQKADARRERYVPTRSSDAVLHSIGMPRSPRAEAVSPLAPRPQPQPQAEPETLSDGCPEAPIEAVEAAPVIPVAAAAEPVTARQEPLAAEPTRNAPPAPPVAIPRCLSRATRKAMARAAHRSAH